METESQVPETHPEETPSETQEEIVPQSPDESEAIPEAVQQEYDPSQVTVEQSTATATRPVSQSNNTWLIVLVVILLVFLCCCCIFPIIFYFYLGDPLYDWFLRYWLMVSPAISQVWSFLVV